MAGAGVRLDFVLTCGLVLAGSHWVRGCSSPMLQFPGVLSLYPALGQGSVCALMGCWDSGAQLSCPVGVSPPPLKGPWGHVPPRQGLSALSPEISAGTSPALPP